MTPTEQAIVLYLRRQRGWTDTETICRALDLDADTLKSLVWKLRRHGVEVESKRGLGYRIARRQK